jgi:3-(3-hydroxy-phenyl)propionate hydroxylase
LKLAETQPFARRLVNSGRLSTATHLARSPLNSPDEPDFAAAVAPGSAAVDAPVTVGGRRSWLLDALCGGFHGLYFSKDSADAAAALAALATTDIHVVVVAAASAPSPYVVDADGLVAKRYDARPGTFYLLRPDQHVAGRWRRFDPPAIVAALQRATACV